jgi:hypothetical protein
MSTTATAKMTTKEIAKRLKNFAIRGIGKEHTENYMQRMR